jgi:hypothetical protein
VIFHNETRPAGFQCGCGGWVKAATRPDFTVKDDIFGITWYSCPVCGADFGYTKGMGKPSKIESPTGGIYDQNRLKAPQP